MTVETIVCAIGTVTAIAFAAFCVVIAIWNKDVGMLIPAEIIGLCFWAAHSIYREAS